MITCFPGFPFPNQKWVNNIRPQSYQRIITHWAKTKNSHVHITCPPNVLMSIVLKNCQSNYHPSVNIDNFIRSTSVIFIKFITIVHVLLYCSNSFNIVQIYFAVCYTVLVSWFAYFFHYLRALESFGILMPCLLRSSCFDETIINAYIHMFSLCRFLTLLEKTGSMDVSWWR